MLTNYGEIPVLIIDGWAWEMGHNEVPYQEIRELVKRLQPNILIVDHNGQTQPWDEDIIYPDGELDNNVVNRLAEIGQAWKPNESRPPLLTVSEFGRRRLRCCWRAANSANKNVSWSISDSTVTINEGVFIYDTRQA